MGKNVFANGREISCKKDDNKSVCSMPDVCLSPPSPPAGPLPIPYPNTAMASDTSDGSRTVKIGGDEVGMKNASNYKKSTGDEAATKSFGMGVVSHNIQGKLKHAAWSMDVKIEGANAIRHMDMVTQNHMNNTNAVPGMDLAAMAPPTGDPECVELENGVRQDAKNDTKQRGKGAKYPGRLAPNTVMTRANVCGKTVKASTPMGNIKGGKTTSGYLKAKPPQGLERDEGGFIRKPGTEPTIACSKKTYRPGGGGGRGGGSTHTEAKIIEKAVADGCNSITMRINWNSSPRGKPARLRHSPCHMCQQALCVAVRECNMVIQICRANDKGELVKEPACPSPAPAPATALPPAPATLAPATPQ